MKRADDRSSTIDATELLKRYIAGERNFEGADLESAALDGADLTGANMKGANLNGTNLDPEQLMQAISLKSATLPDGTVHA